MKKIVLFVAGLFILACNNKKETVVKYSDLRAENINGDVASFEETPIEVDSAVKIGIMGVLVTEYDENGNAIKQVNRHEDGKYEGVITRHKNGLWKSTRTIKNGQAYRTIVNQTDDKGQYISRQEFDSAGKLKFYYTGFTQNEYGQVLTWKQWDKDSVFRQERVSKYEKNLFIERTDKDSTGKIKLTSSAKYNERGEQVEVIKTIVGNDSATTMVTKYTYEAHDEMGNWTQRTTLDEKGKAIGIIKRVYRYRKKE